ncbi:MAG: hypothetical protein M3270_10415 [Thermoproteota archaeon]|nr:hypothetical protein [Thermoproteota archaeon]
MIMEQHNSDTSNAGVLIHKMAIIKKRSQGFTYRSIIGLSGVPLLLVVVTFAAFASAYPAEGSGSNQTAATPAPGGASLGPAGNSTNMTTTTKAMESACLSQNSTAVTTTPSNNTATTTAATVAPSGASIGANDTSRSLAGLENTTSITPVVNSTAVTTTPSNNTATTTAATVAPSGASIC